MWRAGPLRWWESLRASAAYTFSTYSDNLSLALGGQQPRLQPCIYGHCLGRPSSYGSFTSCPVSWRSLPRSLALRLPISQTNPVVSFSLKTLPYAHLLPLYGAVLTSS